MNDLLSNGSDAKLHRVWCILADSRKHLATFSSNNADLHSAKLLVKMGRIEREIDARR